MRGRSSDYEFKCPRCLDYFDVRGAYPAFSAQIERKKRLWLVFVLCPDCLGRLLDLDAIHQYEEQIQIVRNVAESNFDPDWSVTNDFLLCAHHDDVAASILNDLDIPQEVIIGYHLGAIDEISFFPGGPYGLA